MKRTSLFRYFLLFASSVAFLPFLSGPANALRLEVTDIPASSGASLAAVPEAHEPPSGVRRHGLVALPPGPGAIATGNPRLKVQYQAEFPLSITIETDGQVADDGVQRTGALNFAGRIVLSDAWWTPTVSWALLGVDTDKLGNGNVEAGEIGAKAEWKIPF